MQEGYLDLWPRLPADFTLHVIYFVRITVSSYSQWTALVMKYWVQQKSRKLTDSLFVNPVRESMPDTVRDLLLSHVKERDPKLTTLARSPSAQSSVAYETSGETLLNDLFSLFGPNAILGLEYNQLNLPQIALDDPKRIERLYSDTNKLRLNPQTYLVPFSSNLLQQEHSRMIEIKKQMIATLIVTNDSVWRSSRPQILSSLVKDQNDSDNSTDHDDLFKAAVGACLQGWLNAMARGAKLSDVLNLNGPCTGLPWRAQHSLCMFVAVSWCRRMSSLYRVHSYKWDTIDCLRAAISFSTILGRSIVDFLSNLGEGYFSLSLLPADLKTQESLRRKSCDNFQASLKIREQAIKEGKVPTVTESYLLAAGYFRLSKNYMKMDLPELTLNYARRAYELLAPLESQLVPAHKADLAQIIQFYAMQLVIDTSNKAIYETALKLLQQARNIIRRAATLKMYGLEQRMMSDVAHVQFKIGLLEDEVKTTLVRTTQSIIFLLFAELDAMWTHDRNCLNT